MFYVLDRQEKLVMVLTTELDMGNSCSVLSAVQKKQLGGFNALELELTLNDQESFNIQEDFFIMFKNDNDGWEQYIIRVIEDSHADQFTRFVSCDHVSQLLIDDIYEFEMSGTTKTASEYLHQILPSTMWKVGDVDSTVKPVKVVESTLNKTVLELLTLFTKEFDCEIEFETVFNGTNAINNKYVHVKKQVGNTRGKRFDFDRDIVEIKRTTDTTTVKTAIIPIGAEVPDVVEGLPPKRVTIKDVEWTYPDGKKKPKGQSWIGDENAKNQFGNFDTTLKTFRHKTMVMNFDSVSDVVQLCNLTWMNLGRYTTPKVTYETTVLDLYRLTKDELWKHDSVSLGDSVVIVDRDFIPELRVQARVTEMEIDFIHPENTKIVVGNKVESIVDINI